jgi:hypothetical protein
MGLYLCQVLLTAIPSAMDIGIIAQVNVDLLDAYSVGFYLPLGWLNHRHKRHLVVFFFICVVKRFGFNWLNLHWKVLSLSSSLGSSFLLYGCLLDFFSFNCLFWGFCRRLDLFRLNILVKIIDVLIRRNFSAFDFERI